MKNHNIQCGVPEGYSGPELVVVTKNPRNHKAQFRRVTDRNPDYDKIYLAERILRKCKYFHEPDDGLIMYWSGASEFEEMFEYIIANPVVWAIDRLEDDALSLVVESFDEEIHWEER